MYLTALRLAAGHILLHFKDSFAISGVAGEPAASRSIRCLSEWCMLLVGWLFRRGV